MVYQLMLVILLLVQMGDDLRATRREARSRMAFLRTPLVTSLLWSAVAVFVAAALVRTLDTVRGDGCSLRKMQQGEEPGEACMFWNTIISSGAA